ncbi:MAG: hopanoid biosynthesis associated transporter-like protein HpnN [Phenylobacterium sp.]|nr:hopanoid biosynthesis associated transporter-like protein HpnN [Phenylobacterium sp.]
MTGQDAVTRLVAGVVARACRHAAAVVAFVLLLSVAATAYVFAHFSVHTEVAALIPAETPWRRDAAAFERAFAEEGDDITVVIDARTPELAEAAAARLAEALRTRQDLFRSVKRSGAGPFFAHEGLLFLPAAEVSQTAETLIAAQPLVAPLAADPSLRGVMTSLTTGASAAAAGQADPHRLAGPVAAIADAAAAVEQGRPAFFSWRPLITGQAPDPSDLRQFIEILPNLDESRASPGEESVQAVRSFADALRLDPAHGVQVRITGTVPMEVDELATLKEATGPLAAISLVLMLAVLYLAVRSTRIVGAILATVLAGLAITAAAGLALEHRFNLISVAFMPLFVGLGIDFAIQFCVRYRAELIGQPDLERALDGAAAGVGRGLALAAAATAIGFFAFLPTPYKGVSELGLIAGLGMVVAVVLAVTFLPATLVLLKAQSAAAEAGLPALRRADAFVGRRWRWILGLGAGLAVVALVLAPLLRFNFDPLRLRDPHSESVATFLDLARDPDTNPNALDGLSPNLPAARRLAARLSAHPQVRQVITLASFVPADQPAKIASLQDAATLLDPTLNPFDIAAPPTDADQVASLRAAVQALRELGAKPDGSAAGDTARLAGLLERAAAGPPALRARLQDTLVAGLPVALEQVRAALSPEPVTLASLPQEIREDWVARDGRARVQAYPAASPGDTAGLNRFVATVREVMPHAVGTPIATLETRRLILGAFAEAGALALAAITALLYLALRNVREVLLTLAPVLLSALLTIGLCVVLGQDINLENLIALPLLLAVGVSFNNDFVVAHREGRRALLASSLTRAILYSAVATGVAFGALSLSGHPGTASMGRLLVIALGCTLVATLVFQPALLRAVGRAPADR